jgi:hypothetical protein
LKAVGSLLACPTYRNPIEADALELDKPFSAHMSQFGRTEFGSADSP